MRNRKSAIQSAATLLVIGFSLCGISSSATAQSAKALHSFTGGADGASPIGTLVFDSAGHLYGTARFGGTTGGGTAFELAPTVDGIWSEKVLYNFPVEDRRDSIYPIGELIMDSKGNLYGMTTYGGANDDGSVFELSPKSGGTWTEKTLYSFNENGKDGYSPVAGLTLQAGNLYGTTSDGGPAYAGTVFELISKGNGAWTEKILHSFDGKDGTGPAARVIFDSSGNLYGTTTFSGAGQGCGTTRCGTVFELTPKGTGAWTEKVLYNFNNNATDGQTPTSLIFDALGNLYGTTYYGGAYGYGAVFELSPAVGGNWSENLVFSFDGSETGDTPMGLTIDASGNLYGETFTNVFELTPAGGGLWTEKVLYTFAKNSAFGSSGVILDSSGNLYGETWAGGAYDLGAVFEVTP